MSEEPNKMDAVGTMHRDKIAALLRVASETVEKYPDTSFVKLTLHLKEIKPKLRQQKL